MESVGAADSSLPYTGNYLSETVKVHRLVLAKLKPRSDVPFIALKSCPGPRTWKELSIVPVNGPSSEGRTTIFPLKVVTDIREFPNFSLIMPFEWKFGSEVTDIAACCVVIGRGAFMVIQVLMHAGLHHTLN